MKDFITPSLTFTPGASGIGNVDLYGIAGFDVKRLVSIINQTTGTIIYSTADTALRYTQVIGTTVYLNFDTATMSGANTIQVVYDTPYPLPVSVSSLPLPVGAATANNQATEISVLNAINDKNPTLVSGRVPVDGSGVTQPVSAASLPLPTGAATESKQSDGNASLTSIDSKTPVLVAGQVPVVISASVPVTGPLTDTQLRATAVPVTVTGTAAVTGPLTDAQLRATAVPISGTVTANTGLAQPLTDTQLRAASVNVAVTATVLATGAATSSLQGVANTLLTTIDGKTPALVGGAVPVTGPLTDTQLRATAVPVSGTFWQTTQPVSGPLTDTQLRATAVPISGTVTANTGLLQPLTNTELRASAVPVSGTFWQATQPVSGPLTNTELRATAVDCNVTGTVLAAGAASSSLQGVGNTLLTTIDGKTPALGQAAMAASTPVVIASNQSSVPVTAAAPSPTLSTYSVAGVIAINTILLSIDCTQARFLSIQCTSMGTTGTVTPEWSNDNTTWNGAQIVSSSTGSAITSFTAAILANTAVYARYFRLRLSVATTGGTTTFQVQQFDFFASLSTQATSLAALPSLAAGTSAIGDVGIQYRANATGAATSVSVMSPATPAAATIKATAGRLLGCVLQNSAAALRSVKVFNATAPTLGTTSAAFEIDLPAGGSFQFAFEGGVAFTTAMTYSVTSAKGLTDNTSTGLATNDVSGFFAFA
jgi:hypothetical protein